MHWMQGDLFLLIFFVAVPFVPSSRIQLNLILPWFGSKCVKRSHRSEFPQSTYLPCQQERTRYWSERPPDGVWSWWSPVALLLLRETSRSWCIPVVLFQRDLQILMQSSGTLLQRPPDLDGVQCHSSRETSRSWWSPASASDPAGCPVICLPSVSLPSCLPHRLSLLPSL